MKKNTAQCVLTGLAMCITALFGCGGETGPEFGAVSFSPDGKEIVFPYTRGKTSFLFSAEIQDGNASRLTKSDCQEENDPTFSPSGNAIAYSCSGHIHLVKRDGSEIQGIVPSDGRDAFPRFSPDGQKLYFARYGYYGNYSPIAQSSAHEWNIFVIDMSDRKIESLTNENFYGVGELSISPDGKEMMVTTLDQGILVYSTAGGAKIQKIDPLVHSVSPNGGKELANAQFTPDGKSIFFMSASTGTDGFDYDVYKMDLKTGALEQLTRQNGYSTGLRVSPDGKSAIFEKWSKNWRSVPVRPTLQILNLSTGELTKLNIAFKNREN
jgi:Tol biopolymer transport system component